MESIVFEATKLIWTFILLAMTIYDKTVTSSYVIAPWVLFPTLGRPLLDWNFKAVRGQTTGLLRFITFFDEKKF